jgi:mTERF domain-containing protein, mitochondrial
MRFAASNAPTQVSIQNAHLHVEYLVQSCGLSLDDAHRASKHILHLKSSDKPDAVLQFLRETGISESDIRTAVSRDSRILCSHVEKNLRPNIRKLRELGFSIKDISSMISRYPRMLLSNIVGKLDSWLEALGSVVYLSVVLKRAPAVLESSFQNVIMPNLSFLKEQHGLSLRRIVRLISLCPRLITCKIEFLKMKAEEAEELGVKYSSGTFVSALMLVCKVRRSIRDARLNNFRNLGFSDEEVVLLISKAPFLLSRSEELSGRTLEFLIKEAGCDMIDVVRNPNLLMYSLDNRLIPRNIVRKLLMSKGLPVAHRAFVSFVCPTEKQFVDKFILPYEHAIPGLHRAYADASAGDIAKTELLKGISG